MGKTFSVDTDALNTAAAKLKELSGTFSDIARELMDRAETMGSAWDSPDNRDYVLQFQGLTDDLKAMADKLELCGNAIEGQSRNYQKHSEDNSGQVKKLAN